MSTLLDPIEFRGGGTAKNRVALAALTNKQSNPDGTLHADEEKWLARRAAGGFGIITTCATYVTQEGKAWAGELGLSADRHLAGMTRLAALLKGGGALPLVQLFHGGLRADESVSGEPALSASASSAAPIRRAATEADLERIIQAFADAAKRAHQAGMGGVEIHGAHGYLLTQFLSTVDNQRKDAWGGSLENRARLLRRVTQAVRAATPRAFVVGVRVSPEDFGQTRGVDLDESLQVGKWLVEDGVDFLHLSLWDVSRNTTKYPHEHALTRYRQLIDPAVRLFVAGKIWSKEDAERMLAMGADVVALGRCGILNPDWPTRVATQGAEPAHPPMSVADLMARDASANFVEYLKVFKGLVAP